jgi:hypothetical protein
VICRPPSAEYQRALAHAERFLTDYVATMTRFLDDLGQSGREP